MMRWKIREIAEQQGISDADQLAARADLPPRMVIPLWESSSMRVNLPALGRVCQVLGCTPAEMLVVTPEAE